MDGVMLSAAPSPDSGRTSLTKGDHPVGWYAAHSTPSYDGGPSRAESLSRQLTN